MPYSLEKKLEWAKNVRETRRRIIVSMLGGKCIWCGTDNNLELHHLDGTKKSDNVSRMLTGSIDRFILEIDKCIRLCSKCHHAAHGRVATHGSLYMYTRKNCRCTPCRKNWNEYHVLRKKLREGGVKVAPLDVTQPDRVQISTLTPIVD